MEKAIIITGLIASCWLFIASVASGFKIKDKEKNDILTGSFGFAGFAILLATVIISQLYKYLTQ